MDETGEIEPNARLEIVKVTEEMSILRLPDLDGKPIYFPSYAVARETDFGWPGRRHEVLKDMGNTEQVIMGDLSLWQKERLRFALEELKLPTLLAAHAALNTSLELGSYPVPGPEEPTPVALGMQGRPGVGKSFITAMIAIRENCPILNLDSVSMPTAEEYRNHFEEETSTGEQRTPSIERGRELVAQVKEEVGSNKSRQPKTLREMLDVGLNKLLESPNRPTLIICDMPGIPGEYNFGTGKTHGRERGHHAIDLAAAESCESSVLSTHQLTEYTMKRKLDWIQNEVIANHLSVWQEMRQEFEEGVKRKRV